VRSFHIRGLLDRGDLRAGLDRVEAGPDCEIQRLSPFLAVGDVGASLAQRDWSHVRAPPACLTTPGHGVLRFLRYPRAAKGTLPMSVLRYP
jgi:hypothetical protein